MFKNRRDAGQQLAKSLEKYKNAQNVILLALPRGGVVIADEIAKKLNLPLDIVVPRKIGAPGNPEYAIGAITETGEGIFNEEEIRKIDKEWLKKEIEKEKQEAQRRLRVYRGDKPAVNLKDKIVILVDDGVATGLTLKAAIKSVRQKKPKKIVVAVPVGASDSIEEIKKEVDEVVCLYTPLFFGAVGQFYEEFGQTEDEEVIEIMKRHL